MRASLALPKAKAKAKAGTHIVYKWVAEAKKIPHSKWYLIRAIHGS